MRLFRKNKMPEAKIATSTTVRTNYYTIGLDIEKSEEFCKMINEFFGLPKNEHLVSIHADANTAPGQVEIETLVL